MSYLGRSAKLSLKAQEKVSFLATAGQTSKTGLSYVPNFIEVYVNGILLTDTTDFTATNGNSVTFTVALALNDEVTVVSLKTFSVADHYTKTEDDARFLGKAGGTMTGPVVLNTNGASNGSKGLEINTSGTNFESDDGIIQVTHAASGATTGGYYMKMSAGGADKFTVKGDGTVYTTGNVGIGVTPEAWQASRSVLSLGGNSNLYSLTAQGASGYFGVSANGYHDGSWKYISTDQAARYEQSGGNHTFTVAPSGTADAAISWNTAMTINNAGIVTKPLQPAFSCEPSAAQSNVANGTRITLGTEIFDQGGNFTNSIFTAPVTGKYQLNALVRVGQIDEGATYVRVYVRTSNRLYHSIYDLDGLNADPSYWMFNLSVLADLDAGDTADLLWNQIGGVVSTDIHTSTLFSGYLVA